MIDELRHAFELAQQQNEAIQHYIAEIITQELAADEIEVSPELAAELKTAHDEIAAGDVRNYEAYRREGKITRFSTDLVSFACEYGRGFHAKNLYPLTTT